MPTSGSLIVSGAAAEGTVTAVATGPGLTGGPITGSGIISVASVSLTNQVTGVLPVANLPPGAQIGSVSLTTQVSGVLPVANGGIVSSSRVAYTPTLPASLTNTVASANVSMWWRDGGSLWVQGGFIAIGTTGSTDPITISIPATLAIDTAQLSTGTLVGNHTGPLFDTSLWFQQGAAWRPIWATYDTTTTFRFYNNTQIFSTEQLGVGDGVHWVFSLPIVGW